MKKGGAVAALVLVILAALFIVNFKDVLDRFNPFITKEYVYVQINQSAEPDQGRFRYKLTGYNEESKEKKVNFTTSTELPNGTYLKVLAKGSYAQEWEKIKPEEVPKGIQW
ncbi:YxeA family protein [Paenibacillus sp. GD4]|uniref:YxeA family protein n=1 Tax=Paenibacillus sp. GD4 TaxID=3068890 RepID=UPI00279670B4|nr:YxeA family protein [Paenibacillus sp. GD4]MDQ1914060.1 YxeA family protein [Paenibacillus sp. GD4]